MEATPILDSGIEMPQLDNPAAFISRLLDDLSDVWAPLALSLAAAAFIASFLRHYAKLGSFFFFFWKHRKGKSVVSSTPSYDTDDSDDHESLSSSDDSDADTEEDEEVGDGNKRSFQYYKGQSGNNDSPWPWDGSSIVRTWSSGLFGFDVVDLDHDEPIHSFSLAGGGGSNSSTREVESIGLATPDVVMAAGPTAVRLWDARTASGAAATEAVLRRRGSGAHGDEVFVPELRGGREGEVERWWDDSEDGRRRRGVVPVVVEWCRDVVRRFPVLPSTK